MRYDSPSVSYFRSFVFGVEDSLVSTVGLLSGVAIAGVPRSTILLIGIVLIFVESFSMAAGSFLSEESAEELAHHVEAPVRRPAIAGAVMFGSYFLAGFIPLFPYVFLPAAALPWSIGASLAALFALGAVGAKISRIPLVKSGFRMLVIGGVTILIGVAVGTMFPRSV